MSPQQRFCEAYLARERADTDTDREENLDESDETIVQGSSASAESAQSTESERENMERCIVNMVQLFRPQAFLPDPLKDMIAGIRPHPNPAPAQSAQDMARARDNENMRLKGGTLLSSLHRPQRV